MALRTGVRVLTCRSEMLWLKGIRALARTGVFCPRAKEGWKAKRTVTSYKCYPLAGIARSAAEITRLNTVRGLESSPIHLRFMRAEASLTAL